MGNYEREHVFALSQSPALYDFYQVQVAGCDEEIERALAQLRSDVATPQAPLPPPRAKKSHSANGLQFDVRKALFALLGVDLTQIHGLGPYVAVKLVSECGTDMTKWPSAKHFTSWLCLAPGNSAVPKVRVNGRSEDVIFFDGVFFESSLKSIFFAS